MYRLQRAAVLTKLMDKLRQHDSPCGETQVQQAAFLLQEVANVPLDLQFVLYRYGPYCFELQYELTALRADGLVVLKPVGRKSPGFVLTDQSTYIRNLYRPTLRRHEDRLVFVASTLGDRGPAALERLNMAVHASQRPETGETVEEKIAWIRKLTSSSVLKDGDSSCEKLMPQLENVACRVDIPVMPGTTIAANPFSYSESCPTFRTARGNSPAARTGPGRVSL